MNVQSLNVHSVAPGPHTSSESGVLLSDVM